MKLAASRILLGFLALGGLAGCFGITLDYWSSEKYALVAPDTLGQMNLAFARGGSGFISLIGPTIFALGADERFIVVKQHPAADAFGRFDRAITHYFVIERTTSPSLAERQKRVRGPMSRDEFERSARTLSLPGFSKTFADLE